MFVLPEIHHHLLDLCHLDAEVVYSAPVNVLVFELSVGDASHCCCVFDKLDYMADGVSRQAVTHQEGEQDGAQYTALTD